MALPSTGPINMNQVMTELGIAVGSRLDFHDSRVRTLAGRPSGAISMADLRGKSAYTPMTLALYSSETGNNDPMEWFPQSDPPSSYSYNCGITAAVFGGIGPFTYSFSKGSGLGILTYSAQSEYATWTVTVPRFNEPGILTSTPITCAVTDSTGRQISLTKAGQIVTV